MLTIISGGDSASAAELSGMPAECRIQVPGEAHLWNYLKPKSYQEWQSWMTPKKIGTLKLFVLCECPLEMLDYLTLFFGCQPNDPMAV